MAMNLGDAFLTFRGDLTQLNLAFEETAQSAEKLAPAQAKVDALGAGFDRVATDAEVAAAAMTTAGEAGSQAGAQITNAWQGVAKATVQNYQAQKELSAALYAVKSTGGESAEAMSRLAVAQERAATSSAALVTAREAATASAHEAAAAEKEIGENALASEALIGEATGVRIPRHLRGLIAQLPFVGEAFELAFNGVAIFFIISLLVEATEKVIKFAESFHELNEEEKKAFDQYAKDIETASQRTQKLIDLEHERQLAGKTEQEQSRLKAEYNREELASLDGLLQREERRYNQALKTKELFDSGAMKATGRTITRNLGHGEQSEMPEMVPAVSNEAMKAAESTIHTIEELYGKNLDKLRDEVATKNADIGVKSAEQLQKDLEERIKNGEAAVSADKLTGDALLAQEEAQGRLWLAMSKNSYFDQGRLQARFAEDRYNLERDTLVKMRDLEALDPRNEAKVKELNAKIIALDATRNAELLKQEQKFVEQVNAAVEKQREANKNHHEEGFTPSKLDLSDDAKAIEYLSEAFRALGVRGSATWDKLVFEAEEAFKKIQLYGGTATDRIEAQMKLLEARLGQAFSNHDLTGVQKYTKELERLNKTYNTLQLTMGKFNRAGSLGARLFQTLGLDARLANTDLTGTEKAALGAGGALTTMAAAYAQGGATIQQVALQTAEAILQSIASYAFAKGTEQLALGFAALSPISPDYGHAGEHFMSAGLWYGLGATVSVGSHLLAGSGGGSGSGSGNDFNDGKGGPVATTPTSSGNVVPVQNVQHFATGGLVSSPTLAVIGDSITSASRAGSEAILPLEDSRAMSRIASAIAGRMPASGGAGGNIHITLESDIVQTVRKIDHAVKNNGVKLTASNALRVTKKA